MKSKPAKFLAFDLGAESGRGMLATLDGGRLSLEDVHRFPTQGIVVMGVRQWDVTRIYGEMLEAMRRVARAHGPWLDGIGVDTWGVDFGLLASNGQMLGNPVHYRDRRNDGAMEAAFEIVSPGDLYAATGIQFMPFNTAFQLVAMARAQSPLLPVADSLLMMPDLFHYMLCGRRSCEYTDASTTQLLNVHERTWDEGLIARLGLPRRLFLPLAQPGTVLGTLLPDVAAATGLDPGVRVIAPATHDTASAVAAAPAVDGGNWAYLSSGTWSLLGVELAEPLVNDETRALNFTNEGGVDGTIRFLKNIIGLWIVQECRRAWQAGGAVVSYADLMDEAESCGPTRAIVNVDDRRLLAPDDMPDTLRTLAREAGLPVPATRGEVVRCAVESLAAKYAQTLREMEGALGRRTERLHVIGGGCRNTLLNRLTANACQIPVFAGPSEATAAGNALVQAIGAGAVSSIAEARAIVARSFEVEVYEPEI
jgi:rhamnulokinase